MLCLHRHLWWARQKLATTSTTTPLSLLLCRARHTRTQSALSTTTQLLAQLLALLLAEVRAWCGHELAAHAWLCTRSSHT